MSATSVKLATPLEDHGNWLVDLKSCIHNAKQRAARTIDREIVQLYCQTTAPHGG